MISIKSFCGIDYGRFGNQLFQYSLAKILALYNDCKFYLDPSDHFLKFWNQKHLSYAPLNTIKIKTKPYIEQDPFVFDSHIFNINNIDLIGFFQNLSYYESYLSELNNELILNPHILRQSHTYISDHKKNKSTTCIHVRRTDYVSLQKKHGFLNSNYYRYILQKFDLFNTDIFIISDDINKVKLEFSDMFPDSCNVIFVNTLDDIQDFCIMYLCDHKIISNSTFSWWPSFLSKSPNVYAPFPWIMDSISANTKLSPVHINLYPNSWNKINYSDDNSKWKLLFKS